jgi:hypothetical protein
MHPKIARERSQTPIPNSGQSLPALLMASLTRIHGIHFFLPLPMVGYAISLSFSISYKHLRKSRLKSAQQIAKDNLQLFHHNLKELSPVWWTAAVMVQLAQRALDISPQILDGKAQTNYIRKPSDTDQTGILRPSDGRRSDEAIGPARPVERPLDDTGYAETPPSLTPGQTTFDLVSEHLDGFGDLGTDPINMFLSNYPDLDELFCSVITPNLYD